jgi:hypothetical protein
MTTENDRELAEEVATEMARDPNVRGVDAVAAIASYILAAFAKRDAGKQDPMEASVQDSPDKPKPEAQYEGDVI